MAILVSKRRAYNSGHYLFDVPPVCSDAWNSIAWINYIDACGKWTRPVIDENSILAKGILSLMPNSQFGGWTIEKLDDEEEDIVLRGTYTSPMNNSVAFELHMHSFELMAVSLWAGGGERNSDSMYLTSILKLLVEHFKQFI